MKNSELRDALRVISTVNPAMISGKDGVIYISTYTHTSSVMYTLDEPVENPFTVVLSPDSVKNLVKFVAGKKEVEVKIGVDENGNFTISSPTKKAVFVATKDKSVILAAKKIRDEDFVPNFRVNVETLSTALSRVSHYAGFSELADVRFRGYHIYLDDVTLETMATNNKGMAVYKEEVANPSLSAGTYLVTKDFPMLIKGMSGLLSAYIDEKRMIGTIGRYKFVSTFLNIKPLGYRGIIPKENTVKNTIVIDKDILSEALSVGDFFTDDRESSRKAINFTVKNGILTIDATNSENGILNADVEIISGKDDSFTVSFDTFSYMLSNTVSQNIIIKVYEKRIVVENGASNIIGML